MSLVRYGTKYENARQYQAFFKAKRIDTGEWIEGYLMDENYINVPFDDYDACGRFDDPIEIDTDTICQYTGLTDESGQKIWENDIIVCKQYIDRGNFADYCIERGYVEMKYGPFWLHRKQGYYRSFKDWLEDYDYEVIGNIFDNPELLGVGE